MPDIVNKEQLNGNIPFSADRINGNKSLYDASYSEIFWKNFLAGASRSLGGIIIYALFIFGVFGLMIRFFAPLITPALEQLNNVSGSLNRIPKF